MAWISHHKSLLSWVKWIMSGWRIFMTHHHLMGGVKYSRRVYIGLWEFIPPKMAILIRPIALKYLFISWHYCARNLLQHLQLDYDYKFNYIIIYWIVLITCYVRYNYINKIYFIATILLTTYGNNNAMIYKPVTTCTDKCLCKANTSTIS